MSSPSFNIKIAGNLKINAPAFSQQQLLALAGTAIHALRERCAVAVNANDAPALPYSTKGPIYVPISGRGTITRKLSESTGRGMVGEIRSANKAAGTVTLNRTKSTLGGREVFTSSDMRRMKLAGVVILKAGAKSPAGGGSLIVRDTGR